MSTAVQLIIKSLFISILSASVLSAQTDIYYEQITIDDGLPSNEVFFTHDLTNGNLLIATDNGLAVYNGRTMTYINSEDGIPDNVVFKMYEDYRHRVWFSTKSGAVFYMDGDKIVSPDFNQSLIEALAPENYILSIFVDSNDVIYMSSQHTFMGYFKASIDAKEVEIIQYDPERPLNNQTAVIFTLGEDVLMSSMIWRVNLRLLAGNYADLFREWHSNTVKPSDQPTQYIEDRQNSSTKLKIHYITSSEKLDNLRLGRFFFPKGIIGETRYFGIKRVLYSLKGEVAQPLKKLDRSVLSLVQNDNDVFVGTYGGLLHYREVEDSLKLVGHYFKDHIIAHINEDVDGNYWISSANKGVLKVPSFSDRVYEIPPGLRNSESVAQPFWFKNDTLKALVNKALVSYKLESNGFNKIQNIPLTLNPRRRTPLYVEWIGPTRLNTQNFKVHFNHKTGSGHSTADIARRYLQHNQRRRTSMNNDSLVYLNGRRGYSVFSYGVPLYTSRQIGLEEGVPSYWVTKDYTVWIGSYKGLFREQNRVMEYWGDRYPQLAVSIEDVQEDQHGNIWVATKGAGLSIITKDSVYSFDESDGLTSDVCQKIAFYKGYAWIGTNLGLNRIHLGSGNMDSSRVEIVDRYRSGDVVNLLTADDYLIVLSQKDFTFLSFNEDPKPLSYRIFVDELKISETTMPLNWSDELKLNYDQNDLDIKVRINSLLDSRWILYKYRLTGHSSEWRESTSGRIQYQDLQPGTYNLEIIGRSNNGQWTKDVKSLRFVIKPHFLQSTWFRVTVGSLILLFTVLLTRTFIRYKQRIEAREKALIFSNINALKMQINPHFVFNSLNSIQYFIASNKKREANIFLAKFSTLIRNVLYSTDQARISLTKEIERMSNYIELERMRLENSFEWSLEVEPTIDRKETFLPPMLLQPLIENSIWHGLDKVDSEGKLEIKIQLREDALIIRIRDNGPGIKEEKLKEIRESGNKRSIGIQNVLKRLSLISEIEGRDYTLEIISLVESKGQKGSTGTEFVLHIPIRK